MNTKVEIERRFLVNASGFPTRGTDGGIEILQGYFTRGAPSLRVRVTEASAWITVKGKGTISRQEYEMEIPRDMGLALMKTVSAKVSKTRYQYPFRGLTWEVDIYEGDHKGLVVVEVEIPSEDTALDLPPWVGREVTSDSRYNAAALAFSTPKTFQALLQQSV